MAETSNSIPTPGVTPPLQFDPAVWLSHFESVGGGYLATDNQIRLCIVCQNGTPECQCAAHTLIHNLTNDQRGQVVMSIRKRSEIVGPQPDLNAISLETLSDQPPIGQSSSGGAFDGHAEGTHKMDMTHTFALPSGAAIASATSIPANILSDTRRAWDLAMAEFIAAQAECDLYPRIAPEHVRAKVGTAYHAMMKIPAPDRAALRWKLTDLLEDSANCQVLADVARMLGDVASPSLQMNTTDQLWPKLVDDFKTKYADWLVTVTNLDEADDGNACASLPPEPAKPEMGLPANVLDMTIREFRAVGDTPEQKSAWAEYEQDHAAWKVQRDALREQIIGPAKDAYDRTFAIRSKAFEAMMAYRTTNLRDLCEKIEIIAEDNQGCDVPQQYVADILADVVLLSEVLADPRTSTVAVDPVATYMEAFHTFNAGASDEDQYMEAREHMIEWKPPTYNAFIRKFIAMWCEGGAPLREDIDAMLTDGSDLVGIPLSGTIAPVEQVIYVDSWVESVGPDLTKAVPVEEVVEHLGALGDGFAAAFLEACRASSISVTVDREADGIDRLMFGCLCDGQEVLRVARRDVLCKHLKERPDQRQAVVDVVNQSGMFADNQPFASAQEVADAFCKIGGRLLLHPDGEFEHNIPLSFEMLGDETLNGYPLRRLAHRLDATLRRKGAREEIVALVREQGKVRNGWMILEAVEATNA